MLEVAIAIGLGLWFTVSIAAACVAIFRDFRE